MKRILQIATSPGDIVLDSFKGSGTTGHAALEMNREDSVEHDRRKFILVQIPYETKEQETEEFNICREITAECAS